MTKKEKENTEKSEVEEQNNPKKFYIIGIGIICLFICIVAIMYFTNLPEKQEEIEPTSVSYGGYDFVKENNYWVFNVSVKTMVRNKENVQTYKFRVFYTPQEIEHISSPRTENNKSRVKEVLLNNSSLVYITMIEENARESVIGAVQITNVLSHIYKKKVTGGLTGISSDNDSAVPVITCANTTQTHKVVKLVVNESTYIHEQNGCIIVEGSNSEELGKASQKVFYELLGIL